MFHKMPYDFGMENLYMTVSVVFLNNSNENELFLV